MHIAQFIISNVIIQILLDVVGIHDQRMTLSVEHVELAKGAVRVLVLVVVEALINKV